MAQQIGLAVDDEALAQGGDGDEPFATGDGDLGFDFSVGPERDGEEPAEIPIRSFRTIGDVRICFNKTKAKLGAPGSVAHMFDHRAIFAFKHDNEEAVLEALMAHDVDVADIENEDGIITVITPHTEFYKTKSALTEAFGDLHMEIEEITFVPQSVSLNRCSSR